MSTRLIFFVFVFAAIAGLTLLVMVLRKRKASRLLGWLHAAAAVTAFAMLIWYTIHRDASPARCLVSFTLAGIGGFALFIRHLVKITLPKWISILHAIAGISGLLLLATFAF